MAEQKQAQEVNQDNEVEQRLLNELRKIYADAPVGLCYLDCDLRFLHVNDWFAKLNGVPVEAHIGRTIGEVLPDVAADVESQFRHVIETGEPIIQGRVHAETPAHPGVKKHYIHNYYPVREGGTVVGVTCAVEDVNQLTQASEALQDLREELERRVEERTHDLQESEKRYKDLIECSPDVVWRMNRDGVVTFFSSAIKAMSGYDPDELISLSLKEYQEKFFVGESKETTIDLLERRMQGEFGMEENVFILTCRRKDNSHFTAEIRSIPVTSEDGEIVELHGIMRDVSERKQAEEERARLEDQLRQSQKMEAVGKLAGGIAHDFNNLLTAINGYSELLLEGLKPDDPLHQGLSEIRKAGDRAASLTRQLLAFGRKQILQPKVIDLGEVVARMENMLRRLIGEHIELEVRSDTNLQKVEADPGQIDQVIVNLVINARDAMPRGGRIMVSIKSVALDGQAGAALDDLPAGNYVMLAIADNGVGIGEEELSQIFEPFYTTKGTDEGNGLGLSTVFGIVKQSGGGIEVEGERGKGSIFRVYLPQIEASEPVTEAHEPADSPTEGCETILLVEDEEMIRTLIERSLEGFGYTVLSTGRGGEALLTAERHAGPIDLMITDVIMPQMSGPELAERLAPIRPEMSVLYISGYNEEMVVDQGHVDLEGRFLQKPFDFKDMAKKIREILDQPSTL